MDRLLRPSEVAVRLNVDNGTLTKWRGTGEGPRFKKIGGSIRYHESEVMSFISDGGGMFIPTIEKGIPIPQAERGRKVGGYNYHLPLKEMEPGDSFLVPYRSEPIKIIQNRVMSAVTHLQKRVLPDHKFETRTLEDGIRVWRVA